jgi:hypothetical protein
MIFFLENGNTFLNDIIFFFILFFTTSAFLFLLNLRINFSTNYFKTLYHYDIVFLFLVLYLFSLNGFYYFLSLYLLNRLFLTIK